MDSQQHARAMAIFLAALGLAPGERESALAAECGDDRALRAEVEALLAGHAGSGTSGETLRPGEPGAHGFLTPGCVVAGRYRIEGVLGTGGMGCVYRATQLALRREVALKVLSAGASTSEAALARFEREASAVARLRHPHIVTVYDAGTEPGIGAFFAMEIVSGRSLAVELAQRGALPVVECIEIIRQVAEGVEAAHAAGVVHRDLKPANVMLEDSAAVWAKVLDFGIAKLADEAAPPAIAVAEDAAVSLTASGAVFGTPLYMSPEQASGVAVDARTDVWSLGVMLYEMLSGARPFSGHNAPEVFLAILGREPEPLDRVARVPEPLARLVERALAKDVAERVQTALELVRELERVGRAITAELNVVTIPMAMLPASPPTNLGAPADALIGREEELQEVGAELRRAGARLVTLTGPGGAGKTRLARAAARELLYEFEDGAFFVDLSAVRDPTLVASAIAEELGVTESGGRSPAECLAEHLRGKHLLLVLDNFEQVLEAAPLVARLLDAAPRLTALATSRALLHISAEREFAVPPLAVPSGDRLPPVEELGRCAAVALFVERARAARRGFALAERNAPAVAEICRRLDGLPLAIELAAARVKLLSAEELLARLGERLKLLTGGACDLPERQQTMRGAIAWSYDLLEEPERALLRRLAVFEGGCSYEAAEAVCGEGLDVLDGMGSLVDKSLLRQREQEDGEVRFRMLEVVREYALERLEASGEADDARLEHARYFRRLAAEAAPKLRGAGDGEWVARLAREHDNLKAALSALLDEEPEEGAAFVADLRLYWLFRNHMREAGGWFARALEIASAPALRAMLLFGLSNCELRLGDLGAALPRAREAVEASRASGDRSLLSHALNTLGTALFDGDDLAGAREALEEGLAVAREAGDDLAAGNSLISLGEVARRAGDVRGARGFYEQALEADGRNLSLTATCVTLINLGGVSLEEGDVAGAAPFYREALTIASGLGISDMSADALGGLAAVALDAGERERAARLAGSAEALYESAGVQPEQFERALRDRYLAELRATLDAGTLEREWARGRAMTLAEAAEAGLGE
jgi:predicted ATPase